MRRLLITLPLAAAISGVLAFTMLSGVPASAQTDPSTADLVCLNHNGKLRLVDASTTTCDRNHETGPYALLHRAGLDDLTSRLTALENDAGGGGGTDADLSELEGRVGDLEEAVEERDLRISQLEEDSAALEDLLAGMSRSPDGNTLRFSGMNVQIVNGQGATTTSNGLGNLLVGYNAPRTTTAVANRNGSHYVVVGDEHHFTRFGGIVAGSRNSSTGNWASVTGGHGNSAAGNWSTVSGGASNTANSLGLYGSVSGGESNIVWSRGGSVSGGQSNSAAGQWGSVSGGQNNYADGWHSSILGGLGRTVSSSHGTSPQ
jgi:hypothetical protein